MPVPSWIELSIIDVCNRSCVFCPKSNPLVAPDTYQQMENNLIEKLDRILKKWVLKDLLLYVVTENLCYIKM